MATMRFVALGVLVLGLVTGVVVRVRTPASVATSVHTSRSGSASSPADPAIPTTTPDSTPGSGAPPATTRRAASESVARSSTTTLVPPKVGPVQLSDSPPTTRAAGEPTFAVAQAGTWTYRIDGEVERQGQPVDTDADPQFTAEGILRVRQAEGRTQRSQGQSMSSSMSVREVTRTLADAVSMGELTLWGFDDTARTFRLPAGAFEVPAPSEWGRPWTYEATSVDGTTHLRIASRVVGREPVWLDDGSTTTVHTVRVDSVIDVSGDRSGRIERSVWWAPDLGIEARIHEVETLTTSAGKRFRRDAIAKVKQATASPDSLNDQVVPDDDNDGMPDSP